MRLWVKACLVWAAFSLIFGTLTGPDTWAERFTHALVPLIIGLVLLPIIRNLQFRRIYRESGRRGIYLHIGLWLFVAAVFCGPAIAYSLGYPSLRDKLISVLAFFIYGLPALQLIIWLMRLVFKGLRALARLVVPGPSAVIPANTLRPER